MKLRLTLACLLTALACNGAFLFALLPPSLPLRILVFTLLIFAYTLLLAVPSLGRGEEWKPTFLSGGANLLACIAFASLAQLITAAALLIHPGGRLLFSLPVWIINLLVFLLLIGTMLFHAAARLFAASAVLTGRHRRQLILFGVLPLANLFVLRPIYRLARAEYQSVRLRQERNRLREEAKICATKYPVLLLHGILFRDWTCSNYWGRIPAELEANGARLYYGKQETPSDIRSAAAQLQERVAEILAQEGCEKLNIIAHSRAGLDARYAISALGLGGQVASLSTINTPHRGSYFAAQSVDSLPQPLAEKVSALREQIFSRLTDKDPDFYSGISNWSAEAAAEWNESLPDDPGVFYQSIGSVLSCAEGAEFPLNLGYQLIRALGEDNDGLVALSSMQWGAFRLWRAEGAEGISHADVIDLSRRDIPGFDVCECYVQLLGELKERGL